MTNVLSIESNSHSKFSDPLGMYVWPGNDKPVFGSFAEYQASLPPLARFSGDMWIDAEEAALREAERLGIQNMYIVRNS